MSPKYDSPILKLFLYAFLGDRMPFGDRIRRDIIFLKLF